MKKRTIKTLSVLLAVVISLTAAPLSGLAGFDLPGLFNYSIGAKAVSDEMASAETVIPDTTYTVEIQGYEGIYVKFVPSESGHFVITSDNSIEDGYGDPRVYLYDSYGNYISYNDDGENDNNFRLIFNVTEDTEYYIYLNSSGNSAKFSYIINEYVVPTSGTCGENATWEFDKETGTLIISGTGPMENYDYDIDIYCYGFAYSFGSRPWEESSHLIKNVIIEDGITTIGDLAFYNLYNLTSVLIPNSVTVIGNVAFLGCRSLSDISFPESTTSIGEAAFACTSIQSITIPKNVASIGYCAFSHCDYISNFTVDSENAYYSSDDFGVLFNKNKTNLIQYPRENNTPSYTVPSSVNVIENFAFLCCDNLFNVVLPDNLMSIGDGIFAYSSINNIIIPDSVTTIGKSAFCYSDLESITIPDSVTEIGDEAFENAYYLKSIKIPDSVTKIGEGAFKFCKNLTSITVDSNNEYYSSDEYGVLFNKDKTELMQYPRGNTRTSYTIPDSVITIGEFSFAICNYLNTVIICSNVEYIGYNVFYDCDNLWHIYYKGSEEQWNNISIDGNDVLFNTTLHYNADGSEFEEAVIKEPWCYENGEAELHCTLCDNKTTVYAPYLEHSGAFIKTVAPTCYNSGYDLYKCDRCGENYKINWVDYLGHTGGTFVKTVAPTCTENGYTTYICKTCGDTYVADEVPASHTAGEWEVVVEATYEKEGTKIQRCTVCGETVSEEIIPKIVRVTVDDEDTDVSIEFDSDEYDGEVEVVVEESFDGTAFDIIDTTLNTSQKVMYDITMTVDGVETQPNGKITVRIPLPEGYNPNRSFVYHIDTVNGKVEKMPAKYENGYLVFETTHFSFYAIIEENEVLIGDINNDGKVNQLDRTVFTRYLAKWDGYTEDKIDMTSADVNGDGKVNQLDRTILTRHIANWEGYETLPYKS